MNERMFDLALKFKASKLWNTIEERQTFGVLLEDGQIGYVLVTGAIHEHFSISVYIGDAGYRAIYNLYHLDVEESRCPYVMDCVQCSLEARDMLSGEEYEEIRQYKQAHGLKFRAPYPHFLRYSPYSVSAPIQEEAEWTALEKALVAAQWLASAKKEDLEKLNLSYIPFYLSPAEMKTMLGALPEIPLFVVDGDQVTMQRTTIPDLVLEEDAWPQGILQDELKLMRLKKIRHTTELQVEMTRMLEPVQREEGGAPYFPAMLIAIDEKNNTVLQPILSNGPIYNASDMAEEFVNLLLECGVRPTTISIRTQETEAIMQDLCSKAGIRLNFREELPEMDEVLENFDQMTGRDPISLLENMLEDLSDEDLAAMDEDLKGMLREMYASGILPNDVAMRIQKIFQWE